ncbi:MULTISPECIES: hypothetical protein [unclassified Desulfosporosinus]|uniref:hypothetical protein n=1 Tax=unclassified Desulfosporosinus TaxID=2633794 RepID=UPI000B49C542|nr:MULTISPECIES: hypothetical protein [unclassified Desulfosporosinus]
MLKIRLPGMKTGQGFEWLFLGSVLLFVAVFLSVLWVNSHPSWEMWQTKYYRSQIAQLNQKIKATQNPVLKKALEEQWERDIMKEQKPEIKTLILPNGNVERCQTCHLGIEEISASHPSETFGCVVCHGGNALSLDQNQAHAGMYGAGHPGRLEVSQLSCGSQASTAQCHAGHKRMEDNQTVLVSTSLMANKGGELSMVRYMYGLDISPKLSVKPGEIASQVQAPFNGQPLEQKLIKNCLEVCHQNNGKLPEQASLGNGCESCHVLTDRNHTYQGQDVTVKGEAGHGLTHSLTTQIPYTQCNQCHNLGMPDLYTLQFNLRPDLSQIKASSETGKESLSERVKNVYQPGMVFTKCEVELDCIDCHTRQEVMGDGHLYPTEYQALKLQCYDCHGTKEDLPASWTIRSPDDLAFEEEQANTNLPKLKVGDRILKTAKGEELPNIKLETEGWVLTSKVTGEKYPIPLVSGSGCQQNPQAQSSNDCHKCHDVSGNLKK